MQSLPSQRLALPLMVVALPTLGAALVTTLHGLAPSSLLFPGLVLGFLASGGRPGRVTHRQEPGTLKSAATLTCWGLGPLWLPTFASMTATLGAVTGFAPLGGLLPGLIVGWFGRASLEAVRPLAGLRGDRTLLWFGAALLPSLEWIVGPMGPVTAGVVSIVFALPWLLLVRVRSSDRGKASQPRLPQDEPKEASAGADGLLAFRDGWVIGGAVPLVLLSAMPLFGPSLPWIAELCTAVLLGSSIASSRLGHTLTRASGPLIPAAVLALGHSLQQVLPWTVDAIPLGLPALLVGRPTPALVAAGLVGLLFVFTPARPASRHWQMGALTGCVAWLVLPGWLGAEGSLQIAVAVAALASLPAITSLQRKSARLAWALVLTATLLATPSEISRTSLSARAPYRHLADSPQFALQMKGSRGRLPKTEASFTGSLIVLDHPDRPIVWMGGRAVELNPAAYSSDRFFALLPALVSSRPESVLVAGLRHGGVLDALRRSTKGPVVASTVTPLHGGWLGDQGRLNNQALSDPTVRIESTDRLWATGTAHDAVLVQLPPPWVAGAAADWSSQRVAAVAKRLAPGGTAVFRLPLDDVSEDDLGGFLRTLITTFPGVTAWMDPTGASHLFLVARNSPGPVDASIAFAAWRDPALSAEWNGTGLPTPADCLDRLIATERGLAAALKTEPEGGSAALRAGTRVRAGRRSLPLGLLAAAVEKPSALLDLGRVGKEDLSTLSRHLEANASSRVDYLQLLSALTQGDGPRALELAGRMADSDIDTTKDLRALVAPWVRRGDHFAAQGMHEQARAEYLVAVSFSPKDLSLRLRLADSHRRMGQFTQAETEYGIAREMDGTSLQAALGLASIRQQQGLISEAAVILEEAEKVHPGEVILLVNLASLHVQLAGRAESKAGSHLARARVLFQTAAALEPRMPQPRAGLAEVFTALGEHERALSQINQAVALDPNCTFRGWRGQVLWELGRAGEADRELQQALIDCPDHLPALIAFGGLMVDRGCYRQAREAWERVLTYDPNNAQARLNLNELLSSESEERFGDQHCRSSGGR